MEVDYIKEFLVLAELCNYYETAERLYITQPTLTKHIQRLEKNIGASLFDRSTRRVELTEFGKAFIPYARQMADAQDSFMSVVETELSKKRNVLTIASIPVMDQYAITQKIGKFKSENSDITIKIFESFDTDPYSLLKEGQCEFAFVREEETHPDDDYQRYHYAEDELVAVLNKNHPHARHKKISLKLLDGEEFFLAQTKTRLYKYCIAACRNAGFEPNVTFTGHRLENIIRFVAEGLGVSLLMRRQAEYLKNGDVRIVDITPGYKTYVNLVYDTVQEKNYAGKTFLNFLKEHSDIK